MKKMILFYTLLLHALNANQAKASSYTLPPHGLRGMTTSPLLASIADGFRTAVANKPTQEEKIAYLQAEYEAHQRTLFRFQEIAILPDNRRILIHAEGSSEEKLNSARALSGLQVVFNEQPEEIQTAVRGHVLRVEHELIAEPMAHPLPA